MKLIGHKRVNFVAKDTGAVINGYNLFVTEQREDVEGEACERVFVTLEKLGGYKPEVGDEIIIIYNRFGKVAGVQEDY